MENQRKTIKKITIIALILVILWIIMFFTDIYTSTNLKSPIFATQEISVNNTKGGTYKGLGYTVKVEIAQNEATGEPQILSVAMYIFNKVIAASIT